eukprot:scaffold23714_cov37-Tisochrysis_lutea.AAC.3
MERARTRPNALARVLLRRIIEAWRVGQRMSTISRIAGMTVLRASRVRVLVQHLDVYRTTLK